MKFKFAFLAGCVAFAGGAHAQCLSAVPNACTVGGYDPDAVINYMEHLYFGHPHFGIEYMVLEPETNVCIEDCAARFKRRVTQCKALRTDPDIEDLLKDEALIGPCQENGEEQYKQCLADCKISASRVPW